MSTWRYTLAPAALFLVVVALVSSLSGPAISVKAEQGFDDYLLMVTRSGKLMVKLPDGSDDAIECGQKRLPSRTLIYTGDAEVHLLLPDRSLVSLSQEAVVGVVLSNGGIAIWQQAGSSWHRVTGEAASDRAFYYVQTPTGLIAARGTDFGVALDEGGGTIGITVDGETEHYLLYTDITDMPQPGIPLTTIIGPDAIWPVDSGPSAGAPSARVGAGQESRGDRSSMEVITGPPSERGEEMARRNNDQYLRDRLRRLEELRNTMTEAEYNEQLMNILMSSPEDPPAMDASSIDWRCSSIRTRTIPSTEYVVQRARSDPQLMAALDGVIRGGLESYWDFLQHVCDDDVVDEWEKYRILDALAVLLNAAAGLP